MLFISGVGWCACALLWHAHTHCPSLSLLCCWHIPTTSHSFQRLSCSRLPFATCIGETFLTSHHAFLGFFFGALYCLGSSMLLIIGSNDSKILSGITPGVCTTRFEGKARCSLTILNFSQLNLCTSSNASFQGRLL